LNISVDISDFDLIDACGMPGVVSTSVARELGLIDSPPTSASVERAAWLFAEAFASAIDAPLEHHESDAAH
jgi:lipoate-protein ligase B